MKFGYAIIALLMLAPLTSASLQKPNWGIGDYWEYGGNINVREEQSFENMSISVDVTTTMLSLKIEVVGVEIIDIKGHGVPCYKTSATVSAKGLISIEGNLGGKQINYNGNFELGGSGFIYFTTSELAIAKNDLVINLTTDIPISTIPTGAMNAIVEYNPPLDFMNFPVKKGEKWDAESEATFYSGDISSTVPVSYSFECIGKQGKMYVVRSGYNPTEQMFPVNTTTKTLIFWDGSRGMIYELKDQAGTMDLKLIDYKYSNVSNNPPLADFTFQPSNPIAGNNVIFDASASYDSDGTIISYFWEFGDGKNSTQASPSHVYAEAGKYTVRLTVMDNYGATSTKEITLTVGGGGGGGGGNGGSHGNNGNNGTPGFEFIALAIAIALIVLRKFTIFK